VSTSRILVLSASYGEGHNSAARALQAAFGEIPGVEVRMEDLFNEVAPRFDRLSRKGYLGLINHAPWAWKAAYSWLDRSSVATHLFEGLFAHRAALLRHVETFRPHAVCSTYPVYAWLFAQLRRRGVALPPIYTVVTDALTINSLWYRAPAERWFVTDEGSAAALHRVGLPPARVTVSGFPVALNFADRAADLVPPEVAAGVSQRILYMINSGNASVLETTERLIRQPGREVTITAGRNEELRKKLVRMAQGAPARVEVLGWTKRVPELLMTHHLVISKAGGATTQESINALCPMIVNQIFPGQEEGNWELLKTHGAGAYAETPDAIAQTVDAAFAHGGAQLARWRQALKTLARPAAARSIARQVLDERAAAALVQDAGRSRRSESPMSAT
jgi:processive 1,2-diacylglycerol beta-glucosyltransferase